MVVGPFYFLVALLFFPPLTLTVYKRLTSPCPPCSFFLNSVDKRALTESDTGCYSLLDEDTCISRTLGALNDF